LGFHRQSSRLRHSFPVSWIHKIQFYCIAPAEQRNSIELHVPPPKVRQHHTTRDAESFRSHRVSSREGNFVSVFTGPRHPIVESDAEELHTADGNAETMKVSGFLARARHCGRDRVYPTIDYWSYSIA